MSGLKNVKSPVSNIEKKVKKNTFSVNPNNLKRKSKAHSQMKSPYLNQSSESSFVSKPLSPSISAINNMQEFWFNLQQEVSYSSSSSEEFTELLDVINNADSCQTIQLPSQHIVLPHLCLNKPLTIRGSPGTVLEIRNGSITVNLNQNSQRQKVEICEVELVYRVDKLSSKGPFALFVLEGPNDLLEVSDCTLRSENTMSKIAFEAAVWHEIEDVCFWLNGHAFSKFCTPQQVNYNSHLVLKSCNISFFYEAIRGGVNSSVDIERTQILDSKGTALTLVNPQKLTCSDSKISRPLKNCVDIRLVSEHNSLPKSITFKRCKFKSAKGYGVYVWSEHITTYSAALNLHYCFFLNNNKKGLSVVHLNLKSCFIEGNEFRNNQKSNCWLQKVNIETNHSIRIVQNKTSESLKGYGMYLYDVSAEISGLECWKNTLGGVLIGGSKEKLYRLISISNSNLHHNFENALNIINLSLGEVSLHKVKMNENIGNGVYILEMLSTHVQVNLTGCQVTKNSLFGMIVSKAKCQLKDCKFESNYKGDLSMDDQTKKLVHIKNNYRKKAPFNIEIEDRKPHCKETCTVL